MFDAKVTMGAVYRRAMPTDASRLHDIRRRSILEFAPPALRAWAAARFWRSFKPLAALDFRCARGEFGPARRG
jgi:putative acetyltransferase